MMTSDVRLPWILLLKDTLNTLFRDHAPSVLSRGAPVLALSFVLTVAGHGQTPAATSTEKGPPNRKYWQNWMIGCTGIWGHREEGELNFKVSKVDGDSAASGKIDAGDSIVGAFGREFSVGQYESYPAGLKNWFVERAPSIELGDALARATSNGGKLSLMVKRSGITKDVDLQLPITVGFGSNYPWDCPRSKQLLRGIIKQEFEEGGLSGEKIRTSIMGLTLIGADPQKYRKEIDALLKSVVDTLAEVRSGKLDSHKGDPGSWVRSYQALFMGEYHMKYGRPDWLRPHLEHMMDRLNDSMLDRGYGWGHGYSEGNYRKFFGVWTPATSGCVLAIQCLMAAGVENDPATFNKQLGALQASVDRANGEVGYQGYSLNQVPDLDSVLSDDSLIGSEDGNFASMYRQAITALVMQMAGWEDTLKAVTHMMVRCRKAPATGHGCTSEFHGAASSIAACSVAPGYAREFLDNWKYRLELGSRADGSYQINPKKTRDYWGVAGHISRSMVALMLTMPNKQLWLFSNVQDPAKPAPIEPRTTVGKIDTRTPSLIAKMGDSIFFNGEDGTPEGKGLWKKALSTGKVELVKGGFHKRLVSVYHWRERNKIVFCAEINAKFDRELWITDGTSKGCTKLADEGGLVFLPYKDQLYFPAGPKTEAAPKTLWKTDGTASGTGPLVSKWVWPGNHKTGPDTNLLVPALGKFFIAGGVDGVGGGVIAVSDGTTGGTVALAPVGALRHRYWGVEFGDRFYFISNSKKKKSAKTLKKKSMYNKKVTPEEVFRSPDVPGGSGLWVSDGTVQGTSAMKAGAFLPQSLTVAQSGLFFTAESGDKRVMWLSDGTAKGTDVITNEGPEDPRLLTPLGDRVLFAAVDKEYGEELWTTDGTASGTKLLADIYPGPMGSNAGDLVSMGGKVYFTASSGRSGLELWRTDGTSKGTEFLDIVPGPLGSVPRELFVQDGKLYFYTMTQIKGREIWEYDPQTMGGTWQTAKP